jgi:hypothetical protein
MNPFELRYSVFQTAKDFLEQQYKANLAAFDALDKAAKGAAELAPKFPTVEEVIEKAVEINKFVSDANIQKKRERIAAGSGEKMRKPGAKGAPTADAFVQSAKTAKPPKKK